MLVSYDRYENGNQISETKISSLTLIKSCKQVILGFSLLCLSSLFKL